MNTQKKVSRVLCILAAIVLISATSFKNQLNGAVTNIARVQSVHYSLTDVDTGKMLAMQYCQSCHQLPDPSLLNKAVWKYSVLPKMGLYYSVKAAPGRFPGRGERDADPPTVKTIGNMDPVKWMQINAYYINNAPEHLPVTERTEPIHQLPFFEVLKTPQEWYLPNAFTSYAKIDTSVKPHRLIVNNGLTNDLTVLNNKMQTLKKTNLGTSLVNLLFRSGKTYAVNIGYNLAPNDLKMGNISEVAIGQNGVFTLKGRPMFDNLNRPLSMDIVDLNQNGKPDYLIAQFGNTEGRLSWFEKVGNLTKEHVLRNKPGCLKTIIDRDNKLKRPDIWALFAQGDEGIFQYANEGNGVFKEKRILSFPPSYGSISFDLVDFNGDGFKDIVYTCGDNADISQILKPYHGIYIYLNDGKNNFTQKFFYPINGCNKAIVKDFDGDGDMDIATISEYPDEKTPWEAFVYLENKGNFNFQAYTLPPNVPFTRAMTMDSADFDGDGKPDLLLGAGSAPTDSNGNDKKPLFIMLKNISFTKPPRRDN